MAKRSITATIVPMGWSDTDRDCPECFRSLRRFTWALEMGKLPPRLMSSEFCIEHGLVE